MNFIDNLLFKAWLWCGDQFFDGGVVAYTEGEVKGVVFSNDKKFIDDLISASNEKNK